MDRNALDWIFSTFPQALAALSGLMFAGVSFIIGHLDKRESDDDSLVEIIDKMKTLIHRSLSCRFWLCCVVIVLDIITIFINPSREEWIFTICGKWDWYYFFVILLFIVNVISLILIIGFVLSIVNPNYEKNTIDGLKKEYNIQKESSAEYVDGIEFLRLFQKFEVGLREKINKETNGYVKDNRMTMSQILGFIFKHGVINYESYKNLKYINSLRNILTHSSLDENVLKDEYDKLETYLKEYKNWPCINKIESPYEKNPSNFTM